MKWRNFENEGDDRFELNKKSRKNKGPKIKKMKDFDKINISKKKNKPRD